ncbi:unnamed protein product [Mytilus edulis]|uniref:Uncharacterized protein n=1 Tax=Mytilus edulis TaxID=6550 RepID=A0A8S3TFF9_MYTED|nr:unnamed protein product [Mytilus edulis]
MPDNNPEKPFNRLIAIFSAAQQLETTIKHTTVGHGYHHHHDYHTAKPPTTTTRRSIHFQNAILLLEEWVKNDNYNGMLLLIAVERLYHDIYHKMLQNDRKHDHVEGYIKTHINAECRREIMIWIEDLAKHHKSSPTTNATMTETGEHCTHLRDANHVISLLDAWERHNHFADVQRLYLEVALGFHDLTETNEDKERDHDGLHGDDSVSDYKHVHLRLVRLSSYCRQIVFAWIEDDARKHTAHT